MEDHQIRRQALLDALRERVLVLDGAMGTMLQQRDLTADDFGGAASKAAMKTSSLRARMSLSTSTAYYEAGADIVETNSFGSTRIVLAEYEPADKPTSSIVPPRSSPARPLRNFRRPAVCALSRVPWALRRKPLPSPAASRFQT